MAAKKPSKDELFDVFKNFATDEQAEVEGVEVELAPATGKRPAAVIKVARAGNDVYTRRMLEEYEANAVVLDAGGKAAEELDKEITRRVRAETILVGFSGIAYKGKPLEYSVENAMLLLRHKDFRIRVMTEANKSANYAAKAEESDLKN